MVTELKPRTLTLHDLIIRFLDSRRNCAAGTRQYYAILLNNFDWYARFNRWPEAEGITRDHIRDFLDYVATETYRWPEAQRSWYKPAAPATVHHYGRVIKTLFNWAQEEEYLGHNPSLRLKIGSPGYREVEPYRDEEVQAFLQLCDDDARFRYRYLGIRNKAIVSLFVDTGLRLTELSEIRLSQLDPRLQQVRVMGKGAKARVVPINGEAKKSLRRYLDIRPPGGEELWKTDDGYPLSSYSIQIMITRLKKRAGIKGGGGPHRFRHYFATRYLEAGGDINSLRLLLGHSTLYMVLRYTKFVNIQRALAEHGQFSPLDRLIRGQTNGRRSWLNWG